MQNFLKVYSKISFDFLKINYIKGIMQKIFEPYNVENMNLKEPKNQGINILLYYLKRVESH